MIANVKVKDLIALLQQQPEDAVVFVVTNGTRYAVDGVRFNNTIDKTEITTGYEKIKGGDDFVPVSINNPHSFLDFK